MRVTVSTLAVSAGIAACILTAAPAENSDISALVEQMPPTNVEATQKIFQQVLDSGPEGIAEICGMLRPPEEGNDVGARYALSGLAFYLAGAGQESQRTAFGAVLLETVAETENREIRAFLLRQLQKCAGPECVVPLGPYLADPDLAEPACQVLSGISAPGVSKALLCALRGAKGEHAATLIQALADHRAENAVPVLVDLAASQDADVRRTALYALANIGVRQRRLWFDDYSAGQVLRDACGVEDAFEKAMATSWYLLYARRLAEAGAEDRSAAVCREVLCMGRKQGAANVQSAALQTLADNIGDGAVPELVQAATNANRQVSVAALETMLRMRSDKAEAALAGILRNGPSHVRIALLETLDSSAGDNLMAGAIGCLEDRDEAVRLAAIPAAARMGGRDVLPELLAVLRSGDADEIDRAKQAVLLLAREPDMKAIAGAMPGAPAATQVVLLGILQERRATDCVDAVFQAAAAENADVRKAALKALSALASPDDLSKVVDILLQAENEREQSGAQRCVVALAGLVPGIEARTSVLREAYASADDSKKALILGILPELGGAEALKTVVSATDAQDKILRDAAIRALSSWPDDSAAENMLLAAGKSDELTSQVLLLRGYVRVVRGSGRQPGEKIRSYREAMAVASRPEEKKLVLGALVDVKTLESLQFVGAHLSDPEVQSDAAGIVVLIACPEGDYEGLSDPAVRPILETASSLLEGDLKQRLETHLASVPLPVETGRENDQGFTPLFNGTDLSGWIGHTQGYVVEEGTMVCKAGGNIYTEREYGDFVLRFEFKLTPGANNGLGIRTPTAGDPAYAAMEIQILDDTADKYKDLQPWQYHGSIYGIVPSRRGHLKPVGEWNKQEVTAIGPRITVVLNGVTIVDADLSEIEQTPDIHDLKKHPGLHNRKGHIGFLGHGTVVAFRNIRMKDLGGDLKEPPAGFTSLFNGRDLTGWKGLLAGPNDNPIKRAALSAEALASAQAAADKDMLAHWKVENDELVFDGKGHSICTAEDYGDFEMLVDWKIEKGGDSGIYLRGSPQVQIWDHTQHKEGSGGLYNNQKNPAKPIVCADKPVGEWNTFRIRMIGDKVTVHLNDRLVADNVVLENYWDRSRPIFPSGQIELQSHGSVLRFRNLFIRKL